MDKRRGQVVSLERAKAEPNPDVVRALEDLLAKAKAGEIQELAAVGVMPGGQAYRWIAGVRNLTLALGHVEALKLDLHATGEA